MTTSCDPPIYKSVRFPSKGPSSGQAAPLLPRAISSNDGSGLIRGSNRYSPDDSRSGVNSSDFLAPWKPDASCGRLPAQRAARTVAEGLIWRFSLAFGTHSSHLLLLNA